VVAEAVRTLPCSVISYFSRSRVICGEFSHISHCFHLLSAVYILYGLKLPVCETTIIQFVSLVDLF